MRPVSKALLIALALSASTAPVHADNGRIAAGVAGGLLGGVLLGSALSAPRVYAAPPPPPVYYAPAPAPVYIEEPSCRLIKERYWDGYGYRVRRYQVCD